MDIDKILNNIKVNKPLIHSITNYVSINDVANIILACGASPIMAEDEREVEEIVSISDGLNINIGMINENKFKAMMKAGKKANELNIPVSLDPVGIGASKLRYDYVCKLLDEIHFSIIRGNISEIKTIYNHSNTSGVDANISDTVSKENIDDVIKMAHHLSKTYNCIIGISSSIDVISDQGKAYIIYNGHPYMSKVTGTGCMLSGMTLSYISANPDNKIEAAALSFISMGVAGELAYNRILKENKGTSSYRTYLIDYISLINSEDLHKYGRYKEYKL